MKIVCLMGTHGRYSLVCESLACFLAQSVGDEALLIIYNQHPRPLRFDHPRVQIVNDARPQPSLRAIRHAMHGLVPQSAEYIAWWDDDDLYLPWHLEMALHNIGDGVAWKPKRNWVSHANLYYAINQNTFEGSWVFRTDYVQKSSLETHTAYADHPIVRQTLDAGFLRTTDLAGRTSHLYRWNIGATHHSATTGTVGQNDQAAVVEAWRARNQDLVPDGVLVPRDMAGRLAQFMKAAEPLVSADDMAFIRSHLAAPTAS